MASEKDLELLDQYVGNRLTSQARAAFEKKLASDTSLQNEFNIQQRVVEKIREARIKELKAMFNSVPASALEPTGTSLVTQITVGVAIVGAIGAGIYFYLSNEDKVSDQQVAKQEEVTSQAPQTIEPQQEETSTQESPATDQPKSSESESVVPPSENKERDTETPQASDDAKEEAKGPAPLDVFDPSEETEAPGATPETKITESSPLSKSSIVVETDNNNKKYNFHYQFKNGKLYLYGTFEKNLYEIMEFFSGNKRTVFLYYKESYYLLNEENETIKPLAPINDPSLLKKLKDYRGAR
jgi:cytoskeletal protein RodZ